MKISKNKWISTAVDVVAISLFILSGIVALGFGDYERGTFGILLVLFVKQSEQW